MPQLPILAVLSGYTRDACFKSSRVGIFFHDHHVDIPISLCHNHSYSRHHQRGRRPWRIASGFQLNSGQGLISTWNRGYEQMEKKVFLWLTLVCPGLACILMTLFLTPWAGAEGYDEVMGRGKLRHIGVPYAHFVSGSGDGFSVELVQMFSDYLGVRYEYVNTTWERVIADLIGKKTTLSTQKLSTGKPVEIKGDLIANGLTILPWREREILFSTPIFPSGVWIVARADFPHQPIVPSGDLTHDIQSTIDRVKGYRVLAIEGGCLDPALNRLENSGVNVKIMPVKMNLNELIPAIMNNEAECTLLDFPDALVGIQKWPGRVKILGPVSMNQYMGVGFAKSSVRLRNEFNLFFCRCVNEGKYAKLVEKYYPSVFSYYPLFFEGVVRACEKK